MAGTKSKKKPKKLSIAGIDFVSIGKSAFGGEYTNLNGHLLPKNDVKKVIRKLEQCLRYLK